MNELATSTSYPPGGSPTTLFNYASDYFRSVANEHLIHLQTQWNLTDDTEDARRQFIERYQFVQLVPKYYIDNASPFKVFFDDMQHSNMLVDLDTLRITVVFDFEFTNTMLAQFAYNPPCTKEYLARYEPKLEQFLRAVKRVEAKSVLIEEQPKEPRLSVQMHGSWDTRRFWFNYAATKSLDIDAAYWNVLHETGAELLDRAS